MRKIPELLAPAGSLDSVYAAINGGADAVYFGGRTANARNSAKNFSDEEISYAVNLLHDNNKFAYITLNILHTDRELSDVLKFAEHCYINSADAFIIQDIGLSQIIRKYFPDIKLHASTQMAGHNLYSAQKFSELGFTRMVIARELDYDNLKYLTDNSPNNFEIEMFIHGALCSSHSGRCFMSFALGSTRSANRGMCAQPCRLKYNNKYLLSLKDLCLAGHIKEIIELFPASLKIEGRMKPPEYVYNVCKIYRSCLDENRNAAKQEIDFLAKIFSRQGFTGGYFTKDPGISMYGVRTEENKRESQNYISPLLRKGWHEVSRVVVRLPVQNQIPQPPPPADGTPFCEGGFGNSGKSPHKNIKINPKLCLIFNSPEQFAQIAEYLKTDEILNKIYKIFLPLEICENKKIPREFDKIIGVKLPYVIFDSEREQIINAAKNSGVNFVLIDNAGHIDIAKNINPEFELFGNFGLNIANSYSLDEYKKMGFKNIILSPELNFAQIRDINKTINCGIIAYGRTHVMISENCIIKNSGMCKANILDSYKFCGLKNNFYLTDKTGAKFLVGRDGNFGHRNIIYNSVPVYLADKKDLYKNLGLFFICLNFTDENPGQIKKIIFDYALNKENINPPEKFTRGYR
ncbi:MAG: U32 family peptidase [Oscillospiraceae bacterium]|nr:U32 family peptidase [Oscillospiraceae bacterium]